MDDHRLSRIRQLVAAAEAAQSDPEPFLALHTAEAVVSNFGGRRVLGRAALGDAMRAALASPLADVTTSTDIDDIRFVRPDVAVVSCTKHVSDGRDVADTFTTTGSLTYIVVEDEGAWRIALAQTTPVAAG